VFYPAGRGRTKGFDELSFYAEHFDTVEVNSTFYGQPRPEVSAAWASRTPTGFDFSVKLYQKFTHPRMFREGLERKLPEADATAPPGADPLVDALTRPNQTDIDEFRRGVDPLASAGKLGVLLAQFPASFKDTAGSREYLGDLLRAFSDYPIAVELRHRSWSDGIGDTLSLLNEFGAAWVQIDEPKFRFSIAQNYLPNVRGFYYMRLHGRNHEAWWRHEKSEDRYNYLYSESELKEFSDTAAAARELVKKTYLYTNNHFSAKSVANAAMIKKQLGQPLTGNYPATFTERYPGIADGDPAVPAPVSVPRRSVDNAEE
jgi:uncharacterized protein YecE (DUF72 family)